MSSTLPHLIVVDVETSGLDPEIHDVLEVAAIDLTTGEELQFVPAPFIVEWQNRASAPAMRVNRYYERGTYEHELDLDSTRKRWEALGTMLDGNILAGVNPAFDARFVDIAMGYHKVECRRRYQLRDLATYAAGVLAFDPADPVSASEVFQELGIVNSEPHSAFGDARATADAFLALHRTRPKPRTTYDCGGWLR